MKFCIICGKALEKESELCHTCLDFFLWKYKTGLKEELDRFRKTQEYLERWRSTEKEVDE